MNKKIIILISLTITLTFISYSCKTDSRKTQIQSETSEVLVNSLSYKEIEDGWILLFNGDNFNGWRRENSLSFPEKGWIVEDNSMRCVGSGLGEAGGDGGNILYDKKFKDYQFKFDWKISKGGNSGIFYMGEDIPDGLWRTAPEYQILDNENHLDAQLGIDGNRKSASLYDLIPAKPQNSNPWGEWNTGEIMVFKGTVIHKQNDEVVLEYHLGTLDWNNLIENSKFREYEDFGIYREGYISFQDHGDDVWFRNIKIKEL